MRIKVISKLTGEDMENGSIHNFEMVKTFALDTDGNLQICTGDSFCTILAPFWQERYEVTIVE